MGQERAETEGVMSKRGLRPIGVPNDLAELARNLPTQNVDVRESDETPSPPTILAPVPKAPTKTDSKPLAVAEGHEERVQLKLNVRESLHREIQRRAFDDGMTAQAFILDALKAKGLPVPAADLLDGRKRRKRQ